ncbi:MAG: serine/threonine-protein kinase, partial [Kofleriaceae bacterium]
MNLAGAHVDARRHCSRCRASYTDEFEICPRDGQRLTAGTDPLIGLVLAGTYRVASLIGEGGLGSVYLADHLRVPRTYAVKFPRGMWVDHPKSRARFINEAMAAGRLDHPNIASVIDHGETEHGVPYLVMEHARGEMLSEHLLRRGPLPVDEALELLRPIALGLAHAHSWGVVHRDLKPDNIVIEAARPRIVDFGIAILADLGDSGRFTTKGVVIGTPYYMA